MKECDKRKNNLITSAQQKLKIGETFISLFDFNKWSILSLFFDYFTSFQTNNIILQQINVKKCPSSV